MKGAGHILKAFSILTIGVIIIFSAVQISEGYFSVSTDTEAPTDQTLAVPEHIDEMFLHMQAFERDQLKFPEYEFVAPDGTHITISNFQGQYVLLNFWATWCPPCVKELPSLVNLKNYFRQSNLHVITLSLDHTKDYNGHAAFLERYGLNKDELLYRDAMKHITRSYPISGMPTTLLIGPRGHVLYEMLGDIEWMDPRMVEFLEAATEPL